MVGSVIMASADFCQPFLAPHGTRSSRPIDRSPRVRHATFTLMPAAFTSALSVQVSGFEDNGLLTQCDRLICDFYSSSQCFACGFLQPTPRDVNLGVFATCRPASSSPYRACRGLSPPSHPTCHHNKSDSACQGTACHAWHTIKKGAPGRSPFLINVYVQKTKA